jgi:hypothetical protein
MEKDLENLKLDDKPELKEYTIKTNIEDEISIYLPLPSDIKKLISHDPRKIISFNEEKYLSYFKPNNIIDFTSISHIQNTTIRNGLCIFIGGLNSETFDFTKYYEDFSGEQPETENLFENSKNFTNFIEKNKQYIIYSMHLKDIDALIESVKEIGFEFENGKNNILIKSMRESVMIQDKIFIILSASDNIWIKSEKPNLNGVPNDCKINNYTYIFYNKDFIEKFVNKVINHPRCYFGILSSMVYKNLKKICGGLDVDFPNQFKKAIIFDQNTHSNLNEGNKKEKPKFIRNFEKIQKSIKTFLKLDYFNETNILIIESEKDKISDTKDNSILINIFSERYFFFSKEEKEQFEKTQNKIIDYIVNLLDECKEDIREYIKIKPLEI